VVTPRASRDHPNHVGISNGDPLATLSYKQIEEIAAMKPVWTRLIRFLSTDGKIYHGEPIITASELDLGRVTEKDGLKAKVIEGSDLFDTTGQTKVTEKTVDVKKILGPLTKADVPVIRCIGLNYAKHSMFNIFLSRC
jgi:hypothetical protein